MRAFHDRSVEGGLMDPFEPRQVEWDEAIGKLRMMAILTTAEQHQDEVADQDPVVFLWLTARLFAKRDRGRNPLRKAYLWSRSMAHRYKAPREVHDELDDLEAELVEAGIFGGKR